MLNTEAEWAYLPKADGKIQSKIKKDAVMMEYAKLHNGTYIMYEWSLAETSDSGPGVD